MNKFNCVKCGRALITRYLRIGERAKCPSCKALSTVPQDCEEVTLTEYEEWKSQNPPASDVDHSSESQLPSAISFICPNCNFILIVAKDKHSDDVVCPNCKAEPYIPTTAIETDEVPNDNREPGRIVQEDFLPSSNHLVKFKEIHLKPYEEITSWALGYIGEMMGKGSKTQHNGILIITTERVVFYKKGIFTDIFEYMPINKISSIERKSFIGHKTIRLHTSNDELEFKLFDHDCELHLVEAIEFGRAEQSEQPKQRSQNSNPLEDLKKLAELKDLGVITAEEFEEKKKVLLSKI